jgi:SAM-dependent methyltransferase
MDSVGKSSRLEKPDWGKRAEAGFMASGIDPADRRGHKNLYIDMLQKRALEEVLELNGDETVLDFGCGSGRMTYWLAPRVRKVVGLEVTPEMIRLAEENRKSENVEFMLYDGLQVPDFPDPFDFILSVGVLQIMKREEMARTLFGLVRSLKSGGRLCLIEQVSDNPGIGRPKVEDYLELFEDSRLKCRHAYPIRRGRWWLLYLIRYRLIPKKWLPRIASWELIQCRDKEKRIAYYQDFLFLTEKP